MDEETTRKRKKHKRDTRKKKTKAQLQKKKKKVIKPQIRQLHFQQIRKSRCSSREWGVG